METAETAERRWHPPPRAETAAKTSKGPWSLKLSARLTAMRAIVVMRQRAASPGGVVAFWIIFRVTVILESGSIPLLVYATWNRYIEKAKINNMRYHWRGIQSSSIVSFGLQSQPASGILSHREPHHTFPFPPLIGRPLSNGAGLTCGNFSDDLKGSESLDPPPSFPLPYCAFGGGAR